MVSERPSRLAKLSFCAATAVVLGATLLLGWASTVPSGLAGAPTPTPKPPRTCVVNQGMPNQVIITIQKPAGANPQADAQLQQDAQLVQQLCQQAAAGSQRFRQAIKNIGPFIIHVERTAGISFGVEGPPGGGVVDGVNAPGIGTSIDVGDHERTTLHGGDAANQAAVRAVSLLYTLIHEIIGEELPGHDHTVINNEVITVIYQMGLNVTQLGECKPATIGGQRVMVFNWSVTKPSGPVVVQENITVANAGGGRLTGCPAGEPVGGVAELPAREAAPAVLEHQDGASFGRDAVLLTAAGTVAVFLLSAGLALRRRREPRSK